MQGSCSELSTPDKGVDSTKKAMEAAGRLLARRAYSRTELEKHLTSAGFEPGTVEATLQRLHELGLVDDAAFAAEWIENRANRKGLGPRRLREELEKKGIAGEVIDSILDSGRDEELSRATEIAAGHLARVVDLPLVKQANRLQSLLARRGFGAEVVDLAVRAVLPPEGWD